VSADEERGLIAEQTVPHHQFTTTSALGHLGRLVEYHHVRLLAQDALQQLHKPLLGLSEWLEWITDDTADTSEPNAIQLHDVAIEKCHATSGEAPPLFGGWPFVFVLVVIAQDANHPARCAAECRPDRPDLSKPPSPRATGLRPEIPGQDDAQTARRRQVATIAHPPELFRCYLAKQSTTFARAPGARLSLPVRGVQEFPTLQIGGEYQPMQGFREIEYPRPGDREYPFLGGTTTRASIEEWDFEKGSGIPVGDFHTPLDTATVRFVHGFSLPPCSRQM
jgi:hypothetical protein